MDPADHDVWKAGHWTDPDLYSKPGQMYDQLNNHHDYYREHINDVITFGHNSTTVLNLLARNHAESVTIELAFQLGARMMPPRPTKGGSRSSSATPTVQSTPIHQIFEGSLSRSRSRACDKSSADEITQALENLCENARFYDPDGWVAALQKAMPGRGVPGAYLLDSHFSCMCNRSYVVENLLTRAAILANKGEFVKTVVGRRSLWGFEIVSRCGVDVFVVKMDDGQSVLSHMAAESFPVRRTADSDNAFKCLSFLFKELIRRTTSTKLGKPVVLEKFEKLYIKALAQLKKDHDTITFGDADPETKAAARISFPEKKRQLAQTAALLRNVFLDVHLSGHQISDARDALAVLDGKEDTGESLSELCRELEKAATKVIFRFGLSKGSSSEKEAVFKEMGTLNNRMLRRINDPNCLARLRSSIPLSGIARQSMKKCVKQIEEVRNALDFYRLFVEDNAFGEIVKAPLKANALSDAARKVRVRVSQDGSPDEKDLTLMEAWLSIDHFVNTPSYSTYEHSP